MKSGIRRDILIISLSIIGAIILAKFHVFEIIINNSGANVIIEIMIAGLLFTSVFTTAPAMVALGEISQTNNIFMVAILGGFSAMVGDYIIFRFFKNKIEKNILESIRDKNRRKLRHLLHSPIWKRTMAILGALIIASPFPDELGLMLMGISKLKNSIFLPISFTMNTLGILIIAIIANL